LNDSRLRVAILADFAEEGWPSMDLVADSLCARLQVEHAHETNAVLIRPYFRRRFTRITHSTRRRSFSKLAFNADRLVNRFVDYPHRLKRLRNDFDIFHITDHSYAHLAANVGMHRAIVTCHDIDAFRPLLEVSTGARSRLIRLIAARELRGLQGAAMVGCDSEATRAELMHYRLLPPDRTVTIPNGVAAVFSPRPEPTPDREADHLLGPLHADRPELLHVGSAIPRKRIDLLLQVFAGIRKVRPQVRLLRVGGPFTATQIELARKLGVEGLPIVLPFLEPAVLAAVYRRATALLMTSDHEGFGLPLIESMACGAPVIASDLPVFHEVGGDAVEFVPVGDVPAWVSTALRLINQRSHDPAGWEARRSNGFRQAAKFSWSGYARRYAELYRKVASA
jgi:glycosyltransferase involved in cell wall biosynthesis